MLWDYLRTWFCSDLYRPHTRWAADGPYTRVETDLGSLCIIISSVWRASSLPHLIHVSFTPKDLESETVAFEEEFFPSAVDVNVRRAADHNNPTTSYILSSEDGNNRFSYDVHHNLQTYNFAFETKKYGRVEIVVRLTENTSHTGGIGPMGIPTRWLPFPTQWFIFSTRSVAYIRIDSLERTLLETEGLGHQEKNFGATFPTAWIWLQGFTAIKPHEVNVGSIVAAGGEVASFLRTFMICIRSPKGLKWDFGPVWNTEVFGLGLGFIMHANDSRRGRFSITTTNWILGRRAQLVGRSDPATYMAMTAPLSRGHIHNYCHESFSANFRVTLWRRSWSSFKWEEIETFATTNGAALEFGGSWSHWWLDR